LPHLIFELISDSLPTLTTRLGWQTLSLLHLLHRWTITMFFQRAIEFFPLSGPSGYDTPDLFSALTPEELLRLQNETAAQKRAETDPQSLPQCEIVDPQTESQTDCDKKDEKADPSTNSDQTKATTKDKTTKDSAENTPEKKPEQEERKKTNPASYPNGTRLDNPPPSGKSINGSVSIPTQGKSEDVTLTVKDGNLIRDGRRVGQLTVRDGQIFVTEAGKKPTPIENYAGSSWNLEYQDASNKTVKFNMTSMGKGQGFAYNSDDVIELSTDQKASDSNKTEAQLLNTPGPKTFKVDVKDLVTKLDNKELTPRDVVAQANQRLFVQQLGFTPELYEKFKREHPGAGHDYYGQTELPDELALKPGVALVDGYKTYALQFDEQKYKDIIQWRLDNRSTEQKVKDVGWGTMSAVLSGSAPILADFAQMGSNAKNLVTGQPLHESATARELLQAGQLLHDEGNMYIGKNATGVVEGATQAGIVLAEFEALGPLGTVGQMGVMGAQSALTNAHKGWREALTSGATSAAQVGVFRMLPAMSAPGRVALGFGLPASLSYVHDGNVAKAVGNGLTFYAAGEGKVRFGESATTSTASNQTTEQSSGAPQLKFGETIANRSPELTLAAGPAGGDTKYNFRIRDTQIELGQGEERILGRQRDGINAPEVSRTHARIGVDQRGPYVVDLQSTNGTYVTGENGTVRLQPNQRYYLNPGDEVGLHLPGADCALQSQYELPKGTELPKATGPVPRDALRQSNDYAMNHLMSDRVVDGWHNAGNEAIFHEDGKFGALSSRPATVVDRQNDPVLRDTISEAHQKFDSLPAKQRAEALTKWCKQLLTPANMSEKALDDWYDAYCPRHSSERIYLGEYIRMGRGVCSQQALLLKVLCDEFPDLHCTLVRGNGNNQENMNHVWTTIQFDNGKIGIYDPRHKTYNLSLTAKDYRTPGDKLNQLNGQLPRLSVLPGDRVVYQGSPDWKVIGYTNNKAVIAHKGIKTTTADVFASANPGRTLELNQQYKMPRSNKTTDGGWIFEGYDEKGELMFSKDGALTETVPLTMLRSANPASNN
jgi:FHA domain